MARILIPLWQNWQFVNTFEEQYVRADCDESHFTEVQLPHTVNELPYHYFDEKTYQFQSCYRKKLPYLMSCRECVFLSTLTV